jgi:hypothetical protein
VLVVGYLPQRQVSGSSIDGMISDAREDVGTVGFRTDAVRPGGCDDGVHAGGTASAGVGPAAE